MDKSELQLKKKTDIMETYKKNKMIILDLNEKKERYIRELEDFRAKQQVLVKEMIAVNMELENYKEGVENFIQDNPKLGIHDLKKKTNTVISKFFEVLNPNILADQTKKKISFNIDDGKIIISKKIEEDTMTFKQLKWEASMQFDKMEKDFYFTDQNGSIYLDELNVKRALFPLETVIIKNYVPTIKVVPKWTNLDSKIKEEKVNEEKKNVNEISRGGIGKKSKTKTNSIINSLMQNKFQLLMDVILIVFFISLAISAVNFRRIDVYKILVNIPYINLNKEIYSVQKTHPDDLLKFLNDSFNSMLQINSTTTSGNWLKQQNKNLNFLSLTQTRFNVSDCKSTRIAIDLSRIYCLKPNNNFQDLILYKDFNTTYYESEEFIDTPINGIYDDYFTSGYNLSIPINNFAEYNRTMGILMNDNWIDMGTKSLLVTINLYNINFDVFLIIHILYENIQNYFLGYLKFRLVDVNNRSNIYDNISLIFSIIYFLCILYSLKKMKEKETPTVKVFFIPKNFLENLKLIFGSFIKHIRETYRCPNILEWIAFIKCIFYWGICITKSNYYSFISNNLSININQFTDLSYYAYWFDLITYLNCGVIYLFIFSIISHLTYWDNNLKIISKTMLSFFYNISVFFLGFGFLFIIYSNYIAYLLWGDFQRIYYSDYYFTFLKILSMFYRGSIDNSEFDKVMSYDDLINDPKNNNYYLYLIKDSYTPYLNVTIHSNYFTFFVFNLVFYFIANYVIKVGLTAYFLMSLRKEYDTNIKESRILNLK